MNFTKREDRFRGFGLYLIILFCGMTTFRTSVSGQAIPSDILNTDIQEVILDSNRHFSTDGSSCPRPSILNGRAMETVRGEILKYRCSRGFRRVGSRFAVCTEGRWQPQTLCLTRGCVVTDTLLRAGDVHRETERYYGGTVLTFTCDAGYKMVGRGSMFCFSRRKWVGAPPTCVGLNATTDEPDILTTSVYYSTTHSGTEVTTGETTRNVSSVNTATVLLVTDIPAVQSTSFPLDDNSTSYPAEVVAEQKQRLRELQSGKWRAHLKIFAIAAGCVLVVSGAGLLVYVAVIKKRRSNVRPNHPNRIFRFERMSGDVF